jgi:hypothetical protein
VVTAETEDQITQAQGDSKMKGMFFTAVFVLSLIVLSGCYTIPRHYNNNSEVVYYEPIPEPPILIVGPPPPPPPSTRPVLIGTPVVDPSQPRGGQQDLQNNNGSSYGKRDPLQGGNNRGSGTINTLPPVRTPVQKDRDSQ